MIPTTPGDPSPQTDEALPMRLLLISNGVDPATGYLGHARAAIEALLPPAVRRVVFVPYAAVTESYDGYLAAATPALAGPSGREVVGLHAVPEAERAAMIGDAEAIAVGGGNTWKLLATLRAEGLLPIIRERVLAGVPYIGWSAGANVTCPSIRTTNDMPIVDAGGLEALGLVPFQVNPHYLHGNPPGFEGETRETRIAEFLAVDPAVTVIGLREGTMLEVVDGAIRLVGDRPCRVFRHGRPPVELDQTADLAFLLADGVAPDVALERRTWRLAAYRDPATGDAGVPPEVRATAVFADSSVSGSGGCNRYHGGAAVDGDRLAIAGVASTMMACPPPASTVEAAFLASLGEVAGWSIGAGDELRLRDADGTVMLRLAVETTPSLVGTTWSATMVNNGRGAVSSLVAGSEITAVFGDDGRVAGSGGCNRYTASYTLDGAALSIGPAASTRMACLDPGVMDQESAFFAALGRVDRFEIDGDRLQLRAADGALQADFRANAG